MRERIGIEIEAMASKWGKKLQEESFLKIANSINSRLYGIILKENINEIKKIEQTLIVVDCFTEIIITTDKIRIKKLVKITR